MSEIDTLERELARARLVRERVRAEMHHLNAVLLRMFAQEGEV